MPFLAGQVCTVLVFVCQVFDSVLKRDYIKENLSSCLGLAKYNLLNLTHAALYFTQFTSADKSIS